jgi:uncharacterized membrane protein (TIGR02234 family)
MRGATVRQPPAASHNGAVQPVDDSAEVSGPKAAGPARGNGRAYALTVAGGLAAAGTVAVGVTRPWVTATTMVAGLPRIEAAVTGADAVPLAGACGPVLLASFGAVLATRNRFRQGVGALIVAFAAVAIVSAAHPGDLSPIIESRLSARGWSAASPYATSTQPWRWLVLATALTCLVAGLLVVRLGPGWPTMGKRYEAPESTASPAPARHESAGTASLDEETLWRALDEGRDPTRSP